MAKGLHTLTHVEIKAAPAGRALRDGGGLFYRASEKGFGRWAFRFTSSDPDYLAGQAEKGSKTTQREMGLGSFPETSLDAARRKAAAARDLVARDLDPIEEAKKQAEADRAAAKAARAAAQANTMTFGRYADEVFLPTVLPRFSNPAHLQQWRATFATHAARLRDMPLASITRKDVLAVLQPIWDTKNVTASRTRGRLERLFSHATQNGAFTGDNPAAWRQFDATLAPPRKLTRGHFASIPHDEVAPFIEALRARQAECNAALMLEWIALAACRTGEARFAVWSEIDFERNVWAIPAGRMKMRRDHVAPITTRMGEILTEVRRRSLDEPTTDDYVFPGPRPGNPFSEMACLMLLKRMNYGQFTVHGLRATFKSWAATCTEYPRELIEEQLSHQLGAVERAYMRTSAVERRRPLMEAWAAHLDGATAGATAANVTPFAGRIGG
jgi:integrase